MIPNSCKKVLLSITAYPSSPPSPNYPISPVPTPTVPVEWSDSVLELPRGFLAALEHLHVPIASSEIALVLIHALHKVVHVGSASTLGSLLCALLRVDSRVGQRSLLLLLLLGSFVFGGAGEEARNRGTHRMTLSEQGGEQNDRCQKAGPNSNIPLPSPQPHRRPYWPSAQRAQAALAVRFATAESAAPARLKERGKWRCCAEQGGEKSGGRNAAC